MKKLILLFLMGMIGGGAMFGQMIKFQKTYGGGGDDQGMSVLQTTDGGYIITGSTTSYGAGYEDVYLIKTDSLGDTLWTKTYGGTGSDVGWSVQQTTDGGYIIVGQESLPVISVYVIKTNSNGDTIWTKSIYDGCGCSIKQTSDGGYIFTGTSGYGAYGGFNITTIKLDLNGNVVWTKVIGGDSWDVAYSIQQTTDGGYIIAGYREYNTYGLFLIKLNSNGDTLWTNIYGGAQRDVGLSVQQTTDGGFIITGWTTSFGAGSNDVYLLRINSNGNILWSRTYGGIAEDVGQFVRQTDDGGYIIAGLTYSFGVGGADVYLIKTNSGGDTLWTKTYGGFGNEGAHEIQLTADGGFIIVGYTNSYGSGNNDIYLIKTDSLGNSGCNQGVASTITSSVQSQIRNTQPPVVDTYVLNFFNQSIGHGGIVTTICASCDTPAVPGPITGNTLVCIGSVQTYSIDSVSGATSYIWTLPTGWTGSSTSTSITVTVDTPSANISVASVNNCSISTTTRILAVSVSITPNQPAGITGPDTLCINDTATYSIANVAGATSYTWTLPSGWTGTSTTGSIFITSGTNGGYITITANNLCGTSPPDTLFVMVDNCFTGINSLANGDGITLYPNPNDGNMTFGQLGIRNYELGIMDVTGREVYRQAIVNQQSAIINASQLSSGIYFWEMKTTEGLSAKGKLAIIKD